MGTRHIHADVIHAWAEGEEVEYLSLNTGEWLSMSIVSVPAFYEHYEYRIKPKTIKKEGWVNVYSENACGMSIHANKKEADFWAREHRIACVRIEWEETLE